MKQMIASWSMVMVHGLMVAGPGFELELTRYWARETNEAREHLAIGNQMQDTLRPIIWPVPQPKRLKRKFIL